MNSLILRHAVLADVPELLPLLEQLGYPATREELEGRFQDFMRYPGYGIAVACLDQRVIGFVAWSRSSIFIAPKTRFHIEGLVVDISYRGRGVGKKLMLFMEDVARQFSPVIIDLTSGVRRAKDGTHEFYKNLGYENEGALAKLYLRKEIKK